MMISMPVLVAVAFFVLGQGKPAQVAKKGRADKGALIARKAMPVRPKAAGPANAILVEDMAKNPSLPARRPFTIARVFPLGEYPECAKAVVGSQELDTQCDVKTRWPDGTLKHAVFTFWLDLPPGGMTQVDFIAAPCPPADGALAKQQILDYLDGKWGGVVEATANVQEGSRATYAANVREILQAWDEKESDLGVRYWLKGPLVTQIIVEDKSPSLPYDFGWKSDLPGLLVGSTVNPKDTTVTIAATSAADIGQWPLPVNAYIGAEKFRICSAAGNILTLCSNGRGLDGTQVAEQRVSWTALADSGWRDAPEDKYRSLHPLFVVTIYPGWAGVKVDAIMENVWTTKLQDQIYKARVGRGEAGADTVWQKEVLHVAQTRWRKSFWNGAEPPPVRIDHNFPYLVYTYAIPSYDVNLKVASNTIQNVKDHFNRTGRGEVGGFGQWDPRFPDAGARGDIALIPTWYLVYLYTADYALQQAMQANADVSAYVPIHFRESLNDGRIYFDDENVPAFSRPVSINARPTVMTRWQYLNFEEVKAEDRIAPVGVTTTGGWFTDQAHQPAMVYLPYLLTGDWYYQEELQFWSAFNVAYSSPGTCPWCRKDSVGYIYGSTELRAEAWVLRNLAETAFSAPDGTPEKKYFESKLLANIAIRDGRYEVTGSYYYEPAPDCPSPCADTLWRYGRDFDGRGLANPLHFPMHGSDGLNETPLIDTKVTYASGIPWQGSYLHVALRHIQDLGYQEIQPLRNTLASNVIQMLQHPDFNPYLAAEYLMPTKRQPDQLFFTNWADTLRGFGAAYQAEKDFPQARIESPTHYPYLLNAAASCMTSITDPQGFSGAAAYQWVNGHIRNQLLAADPTWALVPRQEEGAAGAPSAAAARKAAQPKWYKPAQGSLGSTVAVQNPKKKR